MKKLPSFIFVVTFTVLILFAAEIPKDKENITLKSDKTGDVAFSHLKHSKIEGMQCVFCHHKNETADKISRCSACHGVNEDAPKPMKAFHKLCLECHKKFKDNEKVPVKCKQCHTGAI